MTADRDELAPAKPGERGVSEPAKHAGTSLGKAELFVTVFVTGAAVMLVEIIGTRIIGPVFGVSLFVWSALLVVTLGSLATGYYSGGMLVDRTPTPRLLGTAVAAAGVLLGLVLPLDHLVLSVTDEMGPRAGPLVAATLLFAPCLLALGTIGPIAVRLTVKEARLAGHGTGSVYAVSTAGSVIGTLLTGFVLIPAFEVSQIVAGGALLLALVGAALLALHWRAGAPGVALLPLALWALAPTPVEPPGIKVIGRAQSLYGLVQVIDDENRGVRFLRADHSIIGAQFLADHTAGFAFIHLLESVRFLRLDAKDLLQVGLGTGSLPFVLQRRGLTADVVEIDPAVVRFAQRDFGFSARGEMHVEDARTFLRHTDRRYDVIVHDTFTGGTTPEHLLSLEVLQRIHEILRPGGVLALNFAGYQAGPKAEASYAVARTVGAAFRNLRVFRDSAPDERPEAAGNLAFFASDGPLEFSIPTNAWFENKACERVLRSFERWEVLKDVPPGPVITDSQNPLARLQLPIAEEHFAAMNELLPAEVWLQ